MTDFWRDVLMYGSPVVTGAIGWFFGGKNRQKADVESVVVSTDTVQIDNHAKVVNLYKDTLDDLENRYKAKLAEFEDMANRKVDVLQQEINLLRAQIRGLKRENAELKARIKELE